MPLDATSPIKPVAAAPTPSRRNGGRQRDQQDLNHVRPTPYLSTFAVRRSSLTPPLLGHRSSWASRSRRGLRRRRPTSHDARTAATRTTSRSTGPASSTSSASSSGLIAVRSRAHSRSRDCRSSFGLTAQTTRPTLRTPTSTSTGATSSRSSSPLRLPRSRLSRPPSSTRGRMERARAEGYRRVRSA